MTAGMDNSITKKPSNMVFFLENLLSDDPKVDPKQSTTAPGQPSSSANRFSARHVDIGNITFVDGHAEGLRGSQVVETQSGPGEGGAILPQVRIVWTQNPTQTP